ncbi:MAG TPA: Maf family protein [Chondromyces sp.]|nr:Maf family protein [Chondromyces sp.]
MTLPPLVLASASPRRRQLLELLGLAIEIIPADVDERPEAGELPAVFALRAARDKALEVAGRHPERLVLGADTVVELDSSVLGKPRSRAEAAAMLRALSGREHLVHTAVALADGESVHSLVDTAEVRFAALSDQAIEWYVSGPEPMDKAGAYAVQGRGGLFVLGVNGSPHTVVGLPVHRLPEIFACHGLDFWAYLSP